SHSKCDSFGKDRAKFYDQDNSYLAPIYENLHYLIKIVLGDFATQSKILCVGVGTGTEIIKLAEAFPGFTFVAVDPSESMLEVCRDRLQKLNLLDRCKLIHGSVQGLSEGGDFDATLCLLVLHHTSEEDRKKIVAGIAERLKPTGYFIIAELSYDLYSRTSESIMKNWNSLARIAATPDEKIQILPESMREHLSIQAPSDIENMLVTNGFSTPTQFFQSLLIRAWYAQKKS
ncbi:MAG: methyltransferase domain-containing protein, partial [Bdellovibrionota bacterium]